MRQCRRGGGFFGFFLVLGDFAGIFRSTRSPVSGRGGLAPSTVRETLESALRPPGLGWPLPDEE